MAKTHYSLTWEKFHSTMSAGFGLLQQNGEFVDLTLAADGHLVKVHQVVLGIASPYIKELIQSASCKHPVIFMNNISYTVLENILQYIYTGEVSIEENNLAPFLDAAKTLQIRGLDGTFQTSKLAFNVGQSETLNLRGSTPDTTPKTETSDLAIIRTEEDDENPEQEDDFSVFGDDRSIHSSSPIFGHDYKYKVEVLRSDTTKLTEEVELPSTAKNVKLKRKYSPTTTPGRGERKKRRTLTRRTNLPRIITESSNHAGDIEQLKDGTNNNGNKSPKAALNYTVSERGSVQLILNRYMYNLISRRPTPMKSWRCVDNRHLNCPAAVLTQNNLVMQRAHLHNHPFHDKRIQQKISRKAVYSALQAAETAVKECE